MLAAAAIAAGLGAAQGPAEAAVATDRQGRIVAAADEPGQPLLLRLTASGRRDRTFDGNGFAQPRILYSIQDLATLADGRVAVLATEGNSNVVGILKRDGRVGRQMPFYIPERSGAYLTPTQEGGVIATASSVDYCGRTPTNEVQVTKLRPDLSVDTSFGDGGAVFYPAASDFCSVDWHGPVTEPSAFDSKGRIVIGGADFLLRLTPDGGLDPAFGGGDGVVQGAAAHAFALESSDRIVTAEGLGSAMVVRRFGVDGSPDPNFGSGGSTTIPFPAAPDVGIAMTTDSGRPLIAAGSDSCAGFPMGKCQTQVGLARLGAAGMLDPSFGDAGLAQVTLARSLFGIDLANGRTGHIVEAGQRVHPQGGAFATSVVVRFDERGSLAAGFANRGVFQTRRFPQRCGRHRVSEFEEAFSGTPEDEDQAGDGREFVQSWERTTFVHGLNGSDLIQFVRAPGDWLCGGQGADEIRVTARDPDANGRQHAFGGNGDDLIALGGDNDFLGGGPGADVLSGGTGLDVLWAGSGDDVVRTMDDQRDLVHCDGGMDGGIADRVDRLFQCERVRRR